MEKKEYMTILRQAPLRERSRKGLSVAAAHALLKIAKDQRYKESVKVICEELEKGLGDLDENTSQRVHLTTQ